MAAWPHGGMVAWCVCGACVAFCRLTSAAISCTCPCPRACPSRQVMALRDDLRAAETAARTADDRARDKLARIQAELASTASGEQATQTQLTTILAERTELADARQRHEVQTRRASSHPIPPQRVPSACRASSHPIRVSSSHLRVSSSHLSASRLHTPPRRVFTPQPRRVFTPHPRRVFTGADRRSRGRALRAARDPPPRRRIQRGAAARGARGHGRDEQPARRGGTGAADSARAKGRRHRGVAARAAAGGGDERREARHAHICAHMHTYAHTCTHAHMRTCTHAHMHTCTHAHMHTCRWRR